MVAQDAQRWRPHVMVQNTFFNGIATFQISRDASLESATRLKAANDADSHSSRIVAPQDVVYN